MKKYICLLILFISAISIFAMFNDYEVSSRARAMSGAVTSFSDDYSAIFYNPAGLRFAENQVGATFYRLLGNDFSSVTSASASYAFKFGSIGVGYQAMNVEYYDLNLTSEQKFSLGHSFYLIQDVITETSFGYSFNLYSLSYHELGSDMALGLNAGFISVLHHRTRLGVMLTNINKPKVGEGVKHELPQALAVGLSYAPYQGVITAVDIKKNFDGETELRTGVEVEVHPIMTLRMGVRNHPASYSFGAGFKVSGIKLDYALSTHAVLDFTHHIALGYKF